VLQFYKISDIDTNKNQQSAFSFIWRRGGQRRSDLGVSGGCVSLRKDQAAGVLHDILKQPAWLKDKERRREEAKEPSDTNPYRGLFSLAAYACGMQVHCVHEVTADSRLGTASLAYRDEGADRVRQILHAPDGTSLTAARRHYARPRLTRGPKTSDAS
jgi:hypothetical protein